MAVFIVLGTCRLYSKYIDLKISFSEHRAFSTSTQWTFCWTYVLLHTSANIYRLQTLLSEDCARVRFDYPFIFLLGAIDTCRNLRMGLGRRLKTFSKICRPCLSEHVYQQTLYNRERFWSSFISFFFFCYFNYNRIDQYCHKFRADTYCYVQCNLYNRN